MQGEKHLAAVFYVNEAGQGLSAARLLELAGGKRLNESGVKSLEAGRPVHFEWAGLICMALVESQGVYRVLKIFIWQSDFVRMRIANGEADPEDLEKDHAAPLAWAFRDACENLHPEAAFFVTRLYEAEPPFIDDLYNLPRLADPANKLYRARLGMLYLDETLCQTIDVPPHFHVRDSLPVSQGLLVFHGKGAKRWT